jgi:glycosyltransferase involved in cell wall biosynthesis
MLSRSTIHSRVIRLLGQRNSLGHGVHFVEFARELKALKLRGITVEDVDVTQQNELQRAISSSRYDDINIWFWRKHSAMDLVKGVRVLWTLFESDRVPTQYIQFLQEVADIVWVPSEWGRAVLVNCGFDPNSVDTVPEGVNPYLFNPFARLQRQTSSSPFRFLAVGKFEERKGYHQLIEAFGAAFRNDPSVELILKADHFLKSDKAANALQSLLTSSNLNNVVRITGNLSARQMSELYDVADVFVFPSRGEGWGLPLIEAIASGVPVISTCFGGQQEFLTEIRGLFLEIEHDLETIADPEFLAIWPGLDRDGGQWAMPKIRSIADNMRFAVAHQSTLSNHAAHASEKIREKFSWRRAAERAYLRLFDRGLLA